MAIRFKFCTLVECGRTPKIDIEHLKLLPALETLGNSVINFLPHFQRISWILWIANGIKTWLVGCQDPFRRQRGNRNPCLPLLVALSSMFRAKRNQPNHKGTASDLKNQNQKCSFPLGPASIAMSEWLRSDGRAYHHITVKYGFDWVTWFPSYKSTASDFALFSRKSSR